MSESTTKIFNLFIERIVAQGIKVKELGAELTKANSDIACLTREKNRLMGELKNNATHVCEIAQPQQRIKELTEDTPILVQGRYNNGSTHCVLGG